MINWACCQIEGIFLLQDNVKSNKEIYRHGVRLCYREIKQGISRMYLFTLTAFTDLIQSLN